MRPAYSLHNPFINRFNEPVTRRQDEMQCDEYMTWLKERNLGGVPQLNILSTVAKGSRHVGRMFAGLCGLLALLTSIAVFIKVLVI